MSAAAPGETPIEGAAPDRRPRAVRGATFSALSTRNYRLFFFGQLVSMSGTWMQTVAQSFLVLRLSDSGTVLGLATAARFAPMFLVGPWGGLVADRLDKRRVLLITQSLSGLLALVFGVLISTGEIRLWNVFVLAAALGLVNVFDNPARQSLISELVPRAQLSNAITLNSVTVNIARILGAAVGGTVAAAVGLALCFDLNAASFLAVLLSLLAMSKSQIVRADPVPRERGQIRAGLRYVCVTPDLLVPLVMIAVIGALAWEFQVSLPLVARNTFHGGAGMYGAMTAVMGAGAVVGGLVAAARTSPAASTLSVSAVGWGASIIAAGLAPTLIVEYILLLFVGYGSVTFNSLAKTTLQLAAAPSMRGRVMALWALAWLGTTPVGGPIIGLAGEVLGARWTLLVGGISTVVVGVIAYPTLRRIDSGGLAETR